MDMLRSLLLMKKTRDLLVPSEIFFLKTRHIFYGGAENNTRHEANIL